MEHFGSIAFAKLFEQAFQWWLVNGLFNFTNSLRKQTINLWFFYVIVLSQILKYVYLLKKRKLFLDVTSQQNAGFPNYIY